LSSAISNNTSLISRVGSFFNWWAGELAGLLPASVKHFFQTDDVQLNLDLSSGRAIIFDPGQDQVINESAFDASADHLPENLLSEIRALNPAHIDTVLILDSGDILFEDFELPAEAEDKLQNILTYEMDRRTPFAFEDVYFDCVVSRASPNAPQIDVRLAVVPREHVKHLLEKCGHWGLRPVAITVAHREGQSAKGWDGLNLLPNDLRSTRPQGIRRLNYLLITALCAMLAFTAFVTLFRQQEYIKGLKQQIASVSQDVREVQSLRNDIDRLVKDSNEVIQKKRQSSNLVAVLNDLSLLIPDDTWLMRFQVHGERVSLQGESANASQLVGLLEASGRFVNVSFSSPVVRDARTGRDRFQISARLASPKDKGS
jgi:general secretion pathway protein L